MENNPWCRFDPYAQKKLEQREAALKKFYKAEQDADEEDEREGTAEKVQGIKEMEAKKGCVSLVKIRKFLGKVLHHCFLQYLTKKLLLILDKKIWLLNPLSMTMWLVRAKMTL